MAPLKAKAGEDEEVDQQMVASNYMKMCRSIGIPSNSVVAEVIRGEDEDAPLKQYIHICTCSSC